MSTLTAAPSPLDHLRLPARTRRGTPAAGVQLRWERLVVLAMLLVTIVWLLGTGLAGTSDADVPSSPPITVVVQPGDTVWALAAVHAPAGTSVQDYAWQVVTHNQVQATALRPGTVLELPR